jgi:hypothetical protein
VDVGDLPPGDREGLRVKIGHGRDAHLGPVRVDDQGERAVIDRWQAQRRLIERALLRYR